MSKKRTLLESMLEALDPQHQSATAETTDSFTIKQPAGTRDEVKSAAVRLGVPFRDLARACFEEGLSKVRAECAKADLREARKSREAKMPSPKDSVDLCS